MIFHRVRCFNTLGKEVVLRVLCWETEDPADRIPKSFRFISSMTEAEAMATRYGGSYQTR